MPGVTSELDHDEDYERFVLRVQAARQLLESIMKSMGECPFENPDERIASGVGLLDVLMINPEMVKILLSILMERVLHVD